MGKDSPADRNRATRLTMIRQLDRLLNEATDPKFTGNVGVEVPSKNGRLGVPKFTHTRFGTDDT